MPSFDIVSEITMHEVRNAVENANRVLSTRYDFRGVEAVIELNEKSETVKVTTESDFQLEQLIEILIGAFVKRGIEHIDLVELNGALHKCTSFADVRKYTVSLLCTVIAPLI